MCRTDGNIGNLRECIGSIIGDSLFQYLRSIIFSISGQPNASLRAFKNPNGSTKGCALFCTTLELLAIRNVSLCTTFHNASGTVPAAHELTITFYLGISLNSSITLSLILWCCGTGGCWLSDWPVPLHVGSCTFMDACP